MTRDLSLVVCGRFHYHRYATYLYKCGSLSKIYYSYKAGPTLGLPLVARQNLFLKEYLLGLHLATFGELFLRSAMPIYHSVWERQLMKVFLPTRINMFLLHGNCSLAMKKARSVGFVIGEAVNEHPVAILSRLHAERQRLSINVALPSKNQFHPIDFEVPLLDRLICPSQAVAKSYIERGFPGSASKVLPYGIEENHRASPKVTSSASGPEKKIIRIVSVGQLTLRKGQHLLLSALNRVAEALPGSQLEVTFIGRCDPPYLKYLHSLKWPFIHIPHLPNDRLMTTLAAYDVFVLASLEDGFGIAALEAASVGIPVVVSQYCGVADVLRMSAAAWVVDPLLEDELAKAVVGAACYKILDRGNLQPYKSWHNYADSLREYLAGIC